MNTWKLSLRCLQHPITIGMIALLLINDHILKPGFPSVLTGKLSDFAGLFFFPLLMAAFIAGFGRLIKRDFAPRWVFSASIVGTFIAFTLIKTWLPANQAASNILGWLLPGGPRQLVLDPTDLIALSILPAAALLARFGWRRPRPAQPTRFGYVMLAAASCAALATSPCIVTHVSRVQALNNQFYLQVTGSYETPQIYTSADGIEWQQIAENLPANLQTAWVEPVSLPKTVCAPQNTLECYRISGTDLIESSQDGGNSWQTEWKVPDGRKTYMLRKPLMSCKTRTDIVVYDITVTQTREGQTRVVGAMGEEGVITRRADGTWERIGIYSATPSPMYAKDPFTGAATVGLELFAFLALGTLAYWIISAWATRRFTRPAYYPEVERKTNRVNTAGFVGLLILATIILMILGFSNNSGESFWLMAIGALCLFITLYGAPLLTWGRIQKVYRRAGLPLGPVKAAHLLTLLLLLPVSEILLLLWTNGIIAHYSTAMIVSIATGGAMLALVIAAIHLCKVPPASAETALNADNQPPERD